MSSGHVLLIDDDHSSRRAFTRVLEIRGFTVTTARRGAEALEVMRSADEVDVIVLDLMMPEVSGWEVRERQLEEGILPDVPVVVFSGTSGDLVEEQIALEAADHLVKPVGPTALCEMVEQYCDDES
ncbi:MAG: response regulator [Bradymonadaceae bacterium]